MSRSRKKHNIIKDKGGVTKSNHNRKVRRKTKIILNSNEDFDEMIFPTKKGMEITNQYDMCDYIFRMDDEKYLRK